MATNGILTDTEITRFIAAVCDLRGEEPGGEDNPVGLTADDVVDTREDVGDYIAKYGRPQETDEVDGLTIMVWRRAQPHKGAPRKDITLAQFGPDRLAVIVG